MNTTPILGLPDGSVIVNSTENVKDYLNSITDGASSMSGKIDTWAGTVNNAITKLDNTKGTVLIDASWISVGYYEATTDKISDYSSELNIILKLDKNNDGTTTLNINGLGTKSLMKYDDSGSLVNLDVDDLIKNHQYFFGYNGSSFLLQGANLADEISYNNTISGLTATNVKTAIDEVNDDIRTISNEVAKTLGDNGTISSRNEIVEDGYYYVEGCIDGTFPDNNGYLLVYSSSNKHERIAIFNTSDEFGENIMGYKAVMVDSLNWEDWTIQPSISMTGLPSNLNTLSTSNLVSAINEINTKVGDTTTLETTDKTNTVNAINENTSKINVLSEDKLDKKATPITNDIDLIALNQGQYYFEGVVPSNKNYPPSVVDGRYRHLTILVLGTKTDSEHGYEVIKLTDGASNISYSKTHTWDNWNAWQETATMDKTPFSLTPTTGIIILSQNCYTQNNISYISILAKKTDETVFDVGINYIAVMPSSLATIEKLPLSIQCFANVSGTDINSPKVGGNIYQGDGGNVVFVNERSDIKAISISGVIVK